MHFFEGFLLTAGFVLLGFGVMSMVGAWRFPGFSIGKGEFTFDLKRLGVMFTVSAIILVIISPLAKAMENIPPGFTTTAVPAIILAMTPFVFLIGGWVAFSSGRKIPDRIDAIVSGVLLLGMFAAVIAALVYAAEHPAPGTN